MFTSYKVKCVIKIKLRILKIKYNILTAYAIRSDDKIISSDYAWCPVMNWQVQSVWIEFMPSVPRISLKSTVILRRKRLLETCDKKQERTLTHHTLYI